METPKLYTNLSRNVEIYCKPKYENVHSKTYLIDGVFYKLFKNPTDELIEEKVNKIKIANSRGINDQIVLGKVEVNDDLKGYAYSVSNYEGLNELQSTSRNTSKKIAQLENLKLRLEELHSKDIIHGNIRLKNLEADKNNNIVFRDLDNIVVNNYVFNDDSLIRDVYIKKYGIGEYLDSLAFNIATISYLEHVVEASAIDYVREFGLPRCIRTAENESIMNVMVSLNKNGLKPFTLNKKRR